MGTHLERVEIGPRVELYALVSSELFKENLVGVERCLCPDGQIVQAHWAIVCLSGVSIVIVSRTHRLDIP